MVVTKIREQARNLTVVSSSAHKRKREMRFVVVVVVVVVVFVQDCFTPS